MILHIVRSGETVKMIADNYQCEISDITSNNFHITDFKNLKPGMKLKIPFLTKPIMETLEETESFISDYYPTLNVDLDKAVKTEVTKKDDVKVVDVKANDVENDVISDEKEPFVDTKRNDKNIVLIKNISYYGNVIPNIDQKYIKKI